MGCRLLLIGSAPCLLEQLPRIEPGDYDTVAVVNNWLNPITSKIFVENNILPSLHFFSDYLYFDLGGRKEIDDLDLRKIMCIPHNKSHLMRRRDFRDFCPGQRKFEAISLESSLMVSRVGLCTGDLWPSTGMLALGHLLLDENAECVDLAGFSFFEGRSHYYDDKSVDLRHHSVDCEKRIYEYFRRNYDCRVL